MSTAGLTIFHGIGGPCYINIKYAVLFFSFVCVVRVADRLEYFSAIKQRAKPASSALNAASEAAPELNVHDVFKCVRCPRVLYIVSNEFLFVLRALTGLCARWWRMLLLYKVHSAPFTKPKTFILLESFAYVCAACARCVFCSVDFVHD